MTSRGELEVAGQQLADRLRVALLGERGEPDEVGEQDGHQAPLGDRRVGDGTCAERRVAARPGVAASGPARAVPHSPQNRSVGALAVPHVGQVTMRRVPQDAQNLRPGSLAVPHARQSNAPTTCHAVSDLAEAYPVRSTSRWQADH